MISPPPFEGADQKITQMLMAKEELDVLEVREFNAKQFSMNGFIENLKPYTDKWKNYDQLTDIAKRRATWVDNTPYYIPNGLYQRVLFYRTDWLKEAGLEVPKTWDELLAAAKKLTDPAKNRYLPGIAATFIFAFVQCWNELIMAVLFIDEESVKTIPVAMNAFIKKYDIEWGAMSAATVLSVIPTMLLFAFCQKYLVEGLTQGAVKG